MGVSVWGSRVLRVRGRSSGEWRSTPVNVLTLNGRRYLVSPRGRTQWVRNLRAAGTGQLVLGKKVEDFSAREVTDDDQGDDDGDDKIQILRAYLRRWKFEVGRFFGGVSAESSDEDLRRIAVDHPVFRISSTGQ
jgi:deazaflavin-dependent oxidoreductase (nitroreductase family)